jgi:hypothetical protein
MLILCQIIKLRILFSIFIFKLEYPNRKVDTFKHVENLYLSKAYIKIYIEKE